MAVIKPADRGAGVGEAIPLHLGDLARQGERIKAIAAAQAEAIIAGARAEAERLLAGGREVGRVEGLAQGREEGLRRGAEEGRAAALDERRAAMEVIEKAWASALGEFNARRDDLVLRGEQDVVRLAMGIARRVVKRALAHDPTLVLEQVRAALALVVTPTRVVLSVHPADEALVRDALPSLAAAIGASAHVDLDADAAVSRGGCVVRTPGGRIDATIEAQLDRLAEALVDAPGAGGTGG